LDKVGHISKERIDDANSHGEIKTTSIIRRTDKFEFDFGRYKGLADKDMKNKENDGLDSDGADDDTNKKPTPKPTYNASSGS
jgi:hypothetical protein